MLLWRAAAHLGIPREAAAPAEAAGLVEIGTRVRFRHPLARSAVHEAAAAPERRRAHGALAAAAALERSADRAGARGGVAASATLLRRAAELTGEPALRATRALAAAGRMRDAGASDDAQEMLALAAVGPLDVRQRARLDLLRAQIAFHRAQQ